MTDSADILIVGTGNFAARILFDLAATVEAPTRVAVAGRNRERLAWLATAARARAHMYGRPLTASVHAAEIADADAAGSVVARLRPAVVLQAASLQGGGVIAGRADAWTKLVAEGGLSASAVFQAVLSARIARSCMAALPGTHFINACFPDVVNGLLAAMGLQVTCGIGNIQILAHAMAGALPTPRGQDLRLLAHYQNLAAWRRLPADRHGTNARAWLDGVEVGDLFERFAAVQLTPEPVIDISGAAAVPLLLALAHGRDWRGHVPGPAGLPGGYPVSVTHGRLALDLPAQVSREAAMGWNRAHEEASGLVVDAHGAAHYTGRLREALGAWSGELARGFHVRDLETVHVAMQQLRQRLIARPA